MGKQGGTSKERGGRGEKKYSTKGGEATEGDYKADRKTINDAEEKEEGKENKCVET